MCWKLVRDGLVEELRRRGVPVSRVGSREEHRAALIAKLFEETYEAASARGEELLEEAADILEALVALVGLEGYTLRDLLEAREAKRRERGGFEGGFVAQLGC